MYFVNKSFWGGETTTPESYSLFLRLLGEEKKEE